VLACSNPGADSSASNPTEADSEARAPEDLSRQRGMWQEGPRGFLHSGPIGIGNRRMASRHLWTPNGPPRLNIAPSSWPPFCPS